DRYDFSGKTDPLIVRELMTPVGFSDDEVRERMPLMRDAYASRIEGRLGPVEVIPGAGEALAALAGRSDVAVGLVTGNWARGAGAKLRRGGGAQDFAFRAFTARGRGGLADPFSVAASAAAGEHRACLPPLAIARAREATGYPFTAADALIIG